MNHYFTSNENLKSNIKTLNYNIGDVDFTFMSDNGVFSKNKVDYGTKLLLDTYLSTNAEISNALDLGCGYGVIGIVIGKLKNCKVMLCDINKRSVHLSLENIKLNKVNGEAIESNCYEKINNKYDLIITNPPIRAGKIVVENILINSKKYLTNNGELWCVIRKDGGAKSFIKLLEKQYKVEIMNKSKGFYIIKSK